jgi:chemotaxis protein methyltransferase CheR
VIPTDDAAFEALTRVISRNAGLVLEAYKDKCLRRRIAVRMRACGVHTYGDYQAVLHRTPDEYDRLRDALTINVTRFYRNAETWNLLRQRVLPELMREREGRVRVWSAGCSSGEEAHTVAMLLAEVASEARRPGWLEHVAIDATDIDRVCLDRARAGRYRRDSFVETPAELVERYCSEVVPGGELEVAERLRRRITVRHLDLSAMLPPRPAYDLIFCRNVVIYFDRPMQERLFVSFADALAPGGILVLGKVETLFGDARERLTLVDARERVYRRPA